MDEKFFLITREFLAETPDETFCAIDPEVSEYAGRTETEVGRICKDALLETLESAEKIGLTLLCAEEFDGIRIVRGSTMSEHIFMNPGQIETVKIALELWAKVGGSPDKLAGALKHMTEAEDAPTTPKAMTREAFEAEFENYAKRARSIGNWIFRGNDGEVRYSRKRRPIPDGDGKMCFIMRDAYEPAWRQCRSEWRFDINQLYELEMFVSFLEHDEELYAQFFRKEEN